MKKTKYKTFDVFLANYSLKNVWEGANYYIISYANISKPKLKLLFF